MAGTPFQSGNAPFVSSDITDADLEQLRQLLLRRRRFDLGMYKDPCIRRRLARRVRALRLPDMAGYVGVLQRDDGELDTLLAALTIHVSHFFRNPSTYSTLQRLLPDLVSRAESAGREVRVWSAGCAAGEEAFSLAMLFADSAPGCRVSILGTDLSPAVLARAREGLYDAGQLTEMPPVRRDRYFRPEGKAFRLDQRICDMVTFERHDLLAETDFPAADLIVCRNVLIYFTRAEQERIFRRFAASLGAGGVLVLGKTETLAGSVRRLFETENMTERIYRRCDFLEI